MRQKTIDKSGVPEITVNAPRAILPMPKLEEDQESKMQSAVAKSIESGNAASNLDSIMNSAKTALQETYDSIHEAIN